jgi:hypothetical protein
LDQTTLLRLGQALIRHKGFLGFGPKGKEELIFLGAYVRLNDLLKIVIFDQANAREKTVGVRVGFPQKYGQWLGANW